MPPDWPGAIAAASIILVCGLFGCLIPLVLLEWQRLPITFSGRDRILGCLSTFGGGVFIGAGFLHLLPEATDGLATLGAYPFAPLFSSIGLILTVLVEVTADALAGSRRAADHLGRGSFTFTQDAEAFAAMVSQKCCSKSGFSSCKPWFTPENISVPIFGRRPDARLPPPRLRRRRPSRVWRLAAECRRASCPSSPRARVASHAELSAARPWRDHPT